MTLDPHCSRVLAMSRAGGAGAPDLAIRRRTLSSLAVMAADPHTDILSVSEQDIPTPAGALPGRLYKPKSAAGPFPAVLYLHGGGWVAGDLQTHDGVCRALAEAGAFAVLAVDYRLAPEHPFPAALTDALSALTWLYNQAGELGLDPTRLAIAGDSAGANIAVAAAALAAARQLPLAAQLLICPILDPGRADGSRAQFAEGYFIDEAVIHSDLAAYLGQDGDVHDPRISVLLTADPASLPPALIHVAEFDPFRDEGLAYAELLARAGAPANATVHPGMIHYFYALPRLVPYAREALAGMGRTLADVLA